MRKVLVAWIGKTDLRAVKESDEVGSGPIAQAVDARSFDEVFLLANYPEEEVTPYLRWLRGRTKSQVEVLREKLTGPTDFGEIYEAAVRSVQHAQGQQARDTALTFHLSPGTPAMAAVWIILGKTRFPAELIESSKQHGVRIASVPFDISADFIPDLLRERDARLRQGSAAEPPEAPEFSDIIHRSRPMVRLVHRARQVAPRDIPVLIEGESGTGKELLARAIHRASLRNKGPFKAVNCGAITPTLLESELFGHEKGAFTGAQGMRKGFFEAAHSGTLFLDELGELPSSAQVKLLRVLQENEVVRVGSSTPIKVDVRVVAATNRTLSQEIGNGGFRADLFYRLAVAVLKLPPLRDRTGDLGLLLDHLLAKVNDEFRGKEPGYKEKKLSAGARNVLLAHPWPGNIRELLNTLYRAAAWSDGSSISAEDAREALLPSSVNAHNDAFGRALGGGFNLPDLLREVANSYLQRAMEEANGNKTEAAKLVGLPSYQTLTNWLNRYEVKP